jgi:uncharacterized YccA/Bax inhibitor family protein
VLKKSSDHLHMVKESYFQHMGFALQFSLRMIGGGIGGFIHALIPALFQTTASTTVKTLHKEMEDRFARQKNEQH